MNQYPAAGLASLVQSRGRNGDSMLVHMSPEEVHGLQRVALAAGGSLSVNPDTGLLEANFLKKLLPTLLGFGLNFLFPGLGAIGSGLLVGGVEAARTGDLGKGLMAGLGAFGGAGFGSALSGVGAAAGDASTKFLAEEAAQGLGKEAGAKAAQEAVSNQIRTMAANPTLSNFGAGAKELFTGGQKLGLGSFGGIKAAGSVMGMPAVAGLGMNVANAMTPDYQMPDLTGQIDDSYYQSEGYDPVTGVFRGGQWRKGYPGFPPRPLGYAAGGSVIPRPNYAYPQAGITRSNYAPTHDYTQSQEVVDGYEVKLDPFTGQEKFADGGAVENTSTRDLFYQDMIKGGLSPEAAERETASRYGGTTPASNPFAAQTAAPVNRQADFDRALADYNKNLFSESMAILAMNPGMSFNKAQEFVKGRAQYNPAIAAGAPDPSMYGVAGASENIANVGDKSANFSWGADLAYDPSIYAKQFDWQKYIAANPDLAAAGIDTPWEAATHYSNYGKNENRAGVSFLNPNYGQEPNIDADMRAELRANQMAAIQGQGQPTRPVSPAATTSSMFRAPTGVAADSSYRGDPTVNLTNTSYTAPAFAPQQSLEQYYQGLLTPPPMQSYDPSFTNYMQNLNRYVTSPVAPPTASLPPKDTTTPPNDRTGPPDTRDKFDPSMIDFSKIDFNNFNFGDFMGGQYGNISQYMTGGDSRRVWDSAQGRFVTQTPARTTGTTTSNTTNTTTTPTDTQNQYDPSKFDPSQYQYNPFEDGFNRDYVYSNYQPNNIAYENNAYMATQIPDFSQVDYAGGTPGFDMGNFQLGDMSGYGTQFQGFQPQMTDFGSTYQPPAMNTPIFNAQPYAPQQQQMDFGSMGNYGLGALGTTYAAPTFQTPSFDFSPQIAAVPTTSFQAPMTTSMDSAAATAPQFRFGNSDVLYGQTDFGMGGEPNIFGFAGGGAIQKAAAGKLVTGDGDGMSDDIRANINGDQEARLADGEFVIPADVVSHIGNGSTDAGAEKLYTMMDRIREARTGRTRQAPEIDAEKYLPA